jgi:hypothetical protein
MNFLTPAAIAVAAGLTIPPLVALYFLKLKRVVRHVPSTMLWRKSVEDLQVNSPFQRLRNSVLLWLQLLALMLGAVALGRPMLATAETYEGSAVLLIDQSASMNVVEVDGRTRLDIAKEQAKRTVDNLSDRARAMVIAFDDRATVASSFDTDKAALKRKIDSITSTHSRTGLAEAVGLAEAYTQSMVIGREDGTDIEINTGEEAAVVFLFSDGGIEDLDRVTVQRLDLSRMQMTVVGARRDNVGILAMDARRHFETPQILEVTATMRNFGPQSVVLDAAVHVDGRTLDVQTVELAAGATDDSAEGRRNSEPPVGSVKVVAFDAIEFEGGGLVEVVLRVQDALAVDDHAWTVVDPPRHVRVLLVTPGNMFLENALATLPIDVVKMTGRDYESAAAETISDGERSRFDLVIMDRHTTARLPTGNYFFFGAIPQIEGVSTGRTIDNEIIFNWDEAHPLLRHTSVETLQVFEWLELKLPGEAVSIIDGQSSPVLAYLPREGSQFLISAFALITAGDDGRDLMNTFWVTSVDFVVFIQNAVGYLSSSLSLTGRRGVSPGDPITIPAPERTESLTVRRPDGDLVTVSTAGGQTAHYAHTRQVGVYRAEPGITGQDTFVVNLFNAVESNVAPRTDLFIAGAAVATDEGSVETSRPAWKYVLLAMLFMLGLEWTVYNRRVYV